MKLAILVVIATTAAACATQRFEESLVATRGYDPEHVHAISSQRRQYISMLGTAYQYGNGSQQVIEAEKKLQTVFCNCHKKLGQKCRQPAAEDMSEQDFALWAKSNAAESALRGTAKGMTNAASASLDPDECP